MTANIYHQITSQDPNTNEILRRWAMLKNVECLVFPVNETGASTQSDNKYFDKEFQEELEIKMRTSEQLSKRWRVLNIKSRDDKELFVEIDRVSTPSTIFEVYASTPKFDIYGNIQFYENHLRRVVVQSND